MSEICFVTSDQVLQDMAVALEDETTIYLDTEFERSQTFYSRLALIQVFANDQIWLVDPIEINDWQPLADIFSKPSILKVLHSGTEDLEVIQHTLGVWLSPIWDSQIAAAMVGMDYSIGYQRLVQGLLSIKLEKSQTRSDWLARPLTQQQVQYAVDDIIHLPAIYQTLQQQAKVLLRESWISQDSMAMVRQVQQLWDPIQWKQAYRQVKMGWQLDLKGQAVLRALAAWREQEARLQDKPRGYIVKDEALIEVCKRRPSSLSQLQAIPGISQLQAKRYGTCWLQVIRQPGLDKKAALLPRPLSKVMRTRLGSLKNLVLKQAKALDMPADTLLRKKFMEQLLRKFHWHFNQQGSPKLWLASQLELIAEVDPFSDTDKIAVSWLIKELLGWRWQVIGKRACIWLIKIYE